MLAAGLPQTGAIGAYGFFFSNGQTLTNDHKAQESQENELSEVPLTNSRGMKMWALPDEEFGITTFFKSSVSSKKYKEPNQQTEKNSK